VAAVEEREVVLLEILVVQEAVHAEVMVLDLELQVKEIMVQIAQVLQMVRQVVVVPVVQELLLLVVTAVQALQIRLQDHQ
jgi:hypothetical protein